MKEYKYVQRAVTGGPTVLGSANGSPEVQNANEFTKYMNDTYFEQGWELASAPTLLQFVPPTKDNAFEISIWGYHLVREVESKSKEK